ncbi:hypothetical protein [Leifsonia poae]|uniref:hypothetical protein n=1 Tax=Leifsonia poae TaxID=110933 RepID=UPI003D675566
MAKKKVLAALLVGVVIALAAPAAANAVPYTKGSSCSLSPTTVTAGGTATLTCTAGTFQGSEPVQYTVSGENGANANLASYRTATSSAHATKVAAADGGAVLIVTVPKDANGAYTITGTGSTSKAASAATVTVLPADAPAAATSSSTGSSTIAKTGSNIAGYIAWLGGALVVAGLIVLAALAGSRRRRTTP